MLAGRSRAAIFFTTPRDDLESFRSYKSLEDNGHWVCTKALRIRSMDLPVLRSGRGRSLMLDIHTYVRVPHASLESTSALAVQATANFVECSSPWFGLATLVDASRCGSHTDDTIANLCRGDSTAIAASFNHVGPRACSFRRRRPISIKKAMNLIHLLYSIFSVFCPLRHSSFLTIAYHLSEKGLPNC